MAKKVTLKKLLKIRDDDVYELLKKRAAKSDAKVTLKDIRREREYRTQKSALQRATRSKGSGSVGYVVAVLSLIVAFLLFLFDDVNKGAIRADLSQPLTQIGALVWLFMFAVAILYLLNIPEFRWLRQRPDVGSGLKALAWAWVFGLVAFGMVIVVVALQVYDYIDLSDEALSRTVTWIMSVGFFGVPIVPTVVFGIFVFNRRIFKSFFSKIDSWIAGD